MLFIVWGLHNSKYLWTCKFAFLYEKCSLDIYPRLAHFWFKKKLLNTRNYASFFRKRGVNKKTIVFFVAFHQYFFPIIIFSCYAEQIDPSLELLILTINEFFKSSSYSSFFQEELNLITLSLFPKPNLLFFSPLLFSRPIISNKNYLLSNLSNFNRIIQLSGKCVINKNNI